MTGPHNPPGDAFDPEARREELLQHLASLQRDDALRQIAILPYYHQLENEITKPNQGVYVTRYFLTKWQPALGSEASSIVLALRLLADKDGRTFASIETIAQYAGMSIRSIKRWISDNEQAIQPCSPERVEQWRLLHAYFLRSKSSRYLLKKDPVRGAIVRRTTSLYEVAMDDPVHPTDEGKLFALAAERLVQEEVAKRQNELKNNEIRHKGQTGPKGPRKSITIETDQVNQVHEGQTGTHESGPNWPSRSLSDRSNVTNVSASKQDGRTGPSLFSRDPRVRNLEPEQRRRLDALVDELGDWLRRKDGWRDTDTHKSAGAHRRAVYLLGEQLVRRAMASLDDRIEEGRSGRKEAVRNPSAAFWGIVKRLAEQDGLSLAVEGEGPAEARTEPLAGPQRATPASALSRQALLEEEQGTPEARAEIYAQHLFPFQYRLQFDRDPSEDEKRAAYEQRLAALTKPKGIDSDR